ncbi:zinc-dependent alcohol dehydrogenase [Kitasatospora sp. NPDC001175]|uniref:zinc-dependent alcohol dehydrogenase n=1 Tax=Kitasatospora sp. NPDC001175 TaxID=3157103 RepID=UPI003D063C30
MKALTFEKAGRVALQDRPVPVPAADEVLVKVAVTGVCGTDRLIVLGGFPAKPGVILGHEAAGEVAAVGAAVTSLVPGDRVVINPTSYCWQCRTCRRGLPAHCEAKDGREIGVDRDGTMAEYVVLPERFVHRLPASMSYRRAALVEPLACVLNNLAAAGPRPDDRILVIGAGPIGALCALVLARRGARVALTDRDPLRLELAESLLPRQVRVLATEETGPGTPAPDTVIDTTGTLPNGVLSTLAAAGTVVVMGERETAVAEVPLRYLVTRGIRLVGAGPYRPADFELALDLAADLPLDSLVTHVLPLDRYAEALALLAAAPAGPQPAGDPGDPGDPPTGYGALKVLLASDERMAP